MSSATQQGDFSAALATSPAIRVPATGDTVTGTVIFLTNKMILVDLNGQFTGIISGTHLHSSIEDVSQIELGSAIEAVVIGDDENAGLVLLSLRKASQMKLIEKLHSNFDTKEIITVVPNEANKGGLLIDLDGIKGFIPVSQLTPVNYPRVEGANAERILEHLQRLVGKPFKVRVINVDQAGKKIIFSEKAAVAEDRARTLEKLKVGDIVEGVVSGILTYGLFVTFDGVEGLVHVSEIDWGHVSNPGKFAKVGDHTRVQVIGIEGDKISLSMKRLRPNPWEKLSELYHVGDVVEAAVVKISQFGVFLGLDGGINGLIHLSEISHSVVKNIEDFVQVGQMVKAKIIAFDVTTKRIGLSMKILEPAPQRSTSSSDEGGEAASESLEKRRKPAKPKKEEVAEGTSAPEVAPEAPSPEAAAE